MPFEHVFDAGIGDLFAIRNAGQIVDDVVLGSIEFAVVALGTPLVVVLRHTRCGAVAAARSGEPVPAPHLQALVDAIAPSVEKVRLTDAELPAGSRRCRTPRSHPPPGDRALRRGLRRRGRG
ncbi:carbonic anhydrase [Curtobacterium flaccumfaciens]